jgi:hypothetical protein
VVHPERVVEYPGLRSLPGGLAERVRQWDQQHDGLYSAALSTASGTKVGGHPCWIQDPEWPQCRCGRRMQHLLTVSSGDDELGRWLPLEDRSDPTSRQCEKRIRVSVPRQVRAGTLSKHALPPPSGFCLRGSGELPVICRRTAGSFGA